MSDNTTFTGDFASSVLTTIPADLFGPATLLAGWAGSLLFEDEPTILLGPSAVCSDVWVISRVGGWYTGKDHDAQPWVGTRAQHLALDLRRPECRARLAAVLLAGERCSSCGGTGLWGGRGEPCPPCDGTGYFRPPFDPSHLLPVAEMGTLPDEHAAWSAPLLAASARRIAVGRPGLRLPGDDEWADGATLVHDGSLCWLEADGTEQRWAP